jgi:hypothetical protein
VTLFADFAGSPQFFNATCTGDCYLDYVINNGTSQYANAYFDVGYVRVFSANSSGNTESSGSGSSGNTGSANGMRVGWAMLAGIVGLCIVAVA